MKRAGTFFILAALAAVGWFYYRNLRGIGPAVLPPAPGVRTATTTSALPLRAPPGVAITVFARDQGAPRVLRMDPEGTLVASIPSRGMVVALPDRDRDGRADNAVTILSGLNRPHGLAFNGSNLFVAETNAIVRYDYDATALTARNPKLIASLPTGGNHTTRTIGIGPDRRLYVSIGSSCNVCVERDSRRAALYAMNLDGSNFKPFATGLRNTVFFSWHPGTGALFGTDMGRDLIGDNLPPDEINIIEAGRDYGWPYCYGANVRDRSFGPKKRTCDTQQPSTLDLPAHSAPLGLAFIPRDGWPERYQGGLLVAYHGSWNRSVPTGYKIVLITDDPLGVRGIEDFITGWLAPDGAALGRPVDILALQGGVLYVSDDKAGVIYKVMVSS